MTTKNLKKNRLLSALNLCLVFAVIVCGFYFIKSIDDLMVKNLELDQLKGQLNTLEEEKKEMESAKNTLESYENISARLQELNMVKVANIDYISVGEDALAKK